MKIFTKKYALSLGMILALTTCSASYANENAIEGMVQKGVPSIGAKPIEFSHPPMKPEGQKLNPEEFKKRMEKRADEFNKALNLSDEQITAAKIIRLRGHEKLKPLFEKESAKRKELRELINNTEIKNKDKRIEKIKAELKTLRGEIRKLRHENEQTFKMILDEDQKIKYEQIKEEGRKYYKEHRTPMSPEHFPHKEGRAPREMK